MVKKTLEEVLKIVSAFGFGSTVHPPECVILVGKYVCQLYQPGKRISQIMDIGLQMSGLIGQTTHTRRTPFKSGFA